MSDELSTAIVVGFPLRGEGWVAVNSPADRIPSHGTDLLGQRFAFDFVKVDQRKVMHFHPAGFLRTLVLGVPARECYAWGALVYAPSDGVIVRAVDGHRERTRIHPVRDAFLALKNGLTFTPAKLPSILGNHVIVRSGEVYAAFVHLVQGSVAVTEGQRISGGDVIGRVGHTGNSTTPHLHFQLMDDPDPLVAKGLPCAFRRYDALRDATWQTVRDGVPGKVDRVRVLDAPAIPSGDGDADDP